MVPSSSSSTTTSTSSYGFENPDYAIVIQYTWPPPIRMHDLRSQLQANQPLQTQFYCLHTQKYCQLLMNTMRKKFAHTFFGWYNDIFHRLDQVREEMNMNMEKTKDALINIKICLCQCTMCYDDVRAWNEFGPMAQLNLLLKIILTVQTRIKICK